ncbi:hypothetical protein [Chitinophaga sp. LS1]|uniref:hypothetical protein n=1 Tax=Chitinophaga sp. LS1 TaxID=3051176 RepID=UPI002AAAF834|nr:hypothetical protein [Chitinophaga sp. LS1]WPV63884.1 hypothetical protein QQL36_18970 [Chitinophaga sp. LS1]
MGSALQTDLSDKPFKNSAFFGEKKWIIVALETTVGTAINMVAGDGINKLKARWGAAGATFTNYYIANNILGTALTIYNNSQQLPEKKEENGSNYLERVEQYDF